MKKEEEGEGLPVAELGQENEEMKQVLERCHTEGGGRQASMPAR